MEVNYDLIEQDYLDFNVYHCENSPSMKKIILLQRWIVPIMFIAIFFLSAKLTSMPVWYLAIVYGGVSIWWILYYPKYIKRQISKRTLKLLKEGRDNTILGNRTIKLTTEGLHEISEHGESKIKWGSIERIEENETHIYIYISSISAFIIPIRAFKDLTSREAFMKELDENTN